MLNRRLVLLVSGGLALGLGQAASQADKRCVIESRTPTPLVVEVSPKGAARIALYVFAATVTLAPPRGGASLQVHARGAIELDALIATDRVPLRTAREVDATNALIHLPRDIGGYAGGIVLRAARGNLVDADVQLAGASLRGLRLPCDSLTLDAVAPAEPRATNEDEAEERFVARVPVLQLRGWANRGSQVDVALGAHLDAIEFRRSDTEGAWWRVSHEWSDGASIDGWVHRDQLAPHRRGALHDLPSLEPPVPITCSRTPTTRANETLARATVAVGTKVYAGRGVGPWATVRTVEPVTVRFLQRDEWVELVSVPGFASAAECPEKSTVLDDAWVPRAAVKLIDPPTPSEAGAAPAVATPAP